MTDQDQPNTALDEFLTRARANAAETFGDDEERIEKAVAGAAKFIDDRGLDPSRWEAAFKEAREGVDVSIHKIGDKPFGGNAEGSLEGMLEGMLGSNAIPLSALLGGNQPKSDLDKTEKVLMALTMLIVAIHR